MDSGWVSLRGYARHRGDTLRAVQKAIQAGRVGDDAVRRDERGHLCAINIALADEQWARNTDPDEALRNGKMPGVLPGEQMPLSAPADAAGDDAPAVVRESDDYLASRAKNERFKAQQSELDYMERVGTLADASAVAAEIFNAYRELRDALEQCAARLSQKLASETDPQRVEHILRDDIRKTLAHVSGQFSAQPADGAGQRAAVGA